MIQINQWGWMRTLFGRGSRDHYVQKVRRGAYEALCGYEMYTPDYEEDGRSDKFSEGDHPCPECQKMRRR